MRESHAKCVRLGRSGYITQMGVGVSDFLEKSVTKV